ncbi:hypothetical protein [Halogeometricum luteum]|uniref:Major facilitator superfamily (MFS) profile domain-containing protein n=1 Tax=Halogeometricum luteum TaxID=2950537 RepID=A0ABU2G628_9EURY|nr:hypothetical protein [Halogeometricum sp. S3BR5-2]MDS0296247.1 hypothetical protein [Halogeometricum sp. S3BR5-2]
MDELDGPPLDAVVAGAGLSLLPVGVGAVTGDLLLGVGAACCLLLAFGLAYPFAKFAAEAD